MATSLLDKRNYQSTDLNQEEDQTLISSTKRVKFSNEYQSTDDTNSSSLFGSTIANVEELRGEDQHNSAYEESLPESNEANHKETSLENGLNSSTSEQFMDPNMQQARHRLSEIHEKMENVLNNFTVKLSELVNQFMGRVQETAIERTSDLKKMMEEVDEMYKRNLETSAQLEKTKELTQQFTLDA